MPRAPADDALFRKLVSNTRLAKSLLQPERGSVHAALWPTFTEQENAVDFQFMFQGRRIAVIINARTH
jgi:hypothetical protein